MTPAGAEAQTQHGRETQFMPQTATTESRIAYCRERDADDYAQVVHGVAHGADEFTRGLNGPKFWPAAELKQAAPTLEGRTVYKIHGDGEREAVGKVLRAAYQANLGVVYEAGINDPDVAEELASGQREVSIEAGNPSTVDHHDETGAVIMRDYEYTGLATPQRGASKANYTAPGPADQNPAVAALSAADVEGALDDDAFDAEAALNAYQSAGGVRFRGTRDGKLDRDALPSDGHEEYFLFNGDTKSTSSYPVVDSSGYLRRGNVAAAYSVGPRGGVSREELYEKLRPLNEAFPTPPINPNKLRLDMTESELSAGDLRADSAVLSAAADAVLADTVSPPTPDDPQGEVQDGSDTDTEPDTDTPMSDDNDDTEVEAFLERLDEKDEQINDLEADLEETEAELSEKEARVEELEDKTDDRIAELEDEVEELREQNGAAREQYAAALAEADTVFDEDELAENYTLAELSAKVEEADFSTDDGGTEPFIRSGSGESVAANLSAAEQEEKAELEAKLDDLDNREGQLAEKERERVEAELAEITGGEA